MKRLLFILSTVLILNTAVLILNSYAFRLPDTGQSKCYQAVSPYSEIPCAGSGQDGAYSTNPMSYTDNGNGTVTDTNTGLVWQKCSVGQNNDASCSGSAAAYSWYKASGTYDASHNPATNNICGDLSLAGGGWRLPSKKELTSIVDYSIPYPGPTIQQTKFPHSVASSYWSSTNYASNPNYAWKVFFMSGTVSNDFKFGGNYVRCVRGVQ
jgi:hypothetical protein